MLPKVKGINTHLDNVMSSSTDHGGNERRPITTRIVSDLERKVI